MLLVSITLHFVEVGETKVLQILLFLNIFLLFSKKYDIHNFFRNNRYLFNDFMVKRAPPENFLLWYNGG